MRKENQSLGDQTMTQQYVQSKADLLWLNVVHGIPIKGVKCAIIHGNEDCPTKITTYFGFNNTDRHIIYQYRQEGAYYDVQSVQALPHQQEL